MDGILQATGTVEFNGAMWAVLAVTVVGAVLADLALHRVRAMQAQPVRVPTGH
ncbi:MAG TPA: hypothetical protein VFK52_03815 [Nocardioidaceae bacterium]|nr:hypothetical protein [Nocardioidaceae bacterium]